VQGILPGFNTEVGVNGSVPCEFWALQHHKGGCLLQLSTCSVQLIETLQGVTGVCAGSFVGRVGGAERRASPDEEQTVCIPAQLTAPLLVLDSPLVSSCDARGTYGSQDTNKAPNNCARKGVYPFAHCTIEAVVASLRHGA
jgi:hypothetical protein